MCQERATADESRRNVARQPLHGAANGNRNGIAELDKTTRNDNAELAYSREAHALALAVCTERADFGRVIAEREPRKTACAHAQR